MPEVDLWPTQAQVDSIVAGQLDWPIAGAWEQYGNPDRQYLVSAPPNHLDTFVAQAPGSYLDGNGKLYRVTDYQGLRGTFFMSPFGHSGLKENTDSLVRYQLWEHVGWAADPYSGPADTIFMNSRTIIHQNRRALFADEPGLPTTRTMYFWDGLSRDPQGEPKLSLYYTDGQGQSTTGSGKVGIDFYEMKRTSAAEDFVSRAGQSEVTRRVSGGRGSGLNVDGTGGAAPQKPEPGVEGDAGETAVHDSYTAVYAKTLAWMRLSGYLRHTASVGTQKRRQRTGGGSLAGGNYGFVDTEATNSLYEMYRPQMLDVVSNVFRNENRIGQIGGSPDTVQSRIQANLRTKLREEGFADAWIDIFFAEEQVHTITPEGFDLHGTDQSRRPIPAGTDPEAIKNMRMNPGDYTTYPWKAPPSPPASRVVVHAPFGYLVPPAGVSGPRGGPPNTQLDNWSRPQMLQRYPADYSFAKYTLHTLNPRIARDEVFYFDYSPNNISYQGLGAQWVEVPRAGDLPIVEFASWALMKVSMDFLIANTRTSSKGHQHPDGLVTGIYEKIEILRRMAQRPYPISIFGLDQLLRISMKRAEMIGKPLEFVISDLNISSMRRTIEAGDKEITTAQVKLTLQEMPVEVIKSVLFGKPNIVVPFMPGDAAAAAAQSGPPLSKEAKLSADFIDTENLGAQDPNYPGVNPAQGGSTTLGNDQAEINYDGWDEWHEELPAGY